MPSTSSLLTRSVAGLPDCEDCIVEMAPAGRHDHRYWTCRYCGNTVPAAA